MKKGFLLFIMLLMLIGCKNENQLTFEPLTLSNDTCQTCPKVEINIPKALDNSKISQSINTALEEELISLLLFAEEMDVTTIEEAITSFNKGSLDLRNKFKDENESWEAKIDGIVTYEDKNIITIQLNSYMFMGGAHGYNVIHYLNFDKKKGVEIEHWELFKDSEHFIKFAETKFRIQEGVPQDDLINATGFMFDNEIFHLPESIGFTKDGLTLHYNQYEVASYADGPIILLLPFNEVKNYLSFKIK